MSLIVATYTAAGGSRALYCRLLLSWRIEEAEHRRWWRCGSGLVCFLRLRLRSRVSSSTVPNRLLFLLQFVTRGFLRVFPFALDLGEVDAKRNVACHEFTDLRREFAVQFFGSSRAAERSCQSRVLAVFHPFRNDGNRQVLLVGLRYDHHHGAVGEHWHQLGEKAARDCCCWCIHGCFPSCARDRSGRYRRLLLTRF